jgi:hypothetical protein
MPLNPNPFTEKELMFLESLRSELSHIRDPHKEIDDTQDFSFYLQQTKKFGPIPKIKFTSNSLAAKERIMTNASYEPVTEKSGWRANRNASASAFDKTWDGLMFKLVKAGKVMTTFNQQFTLEGQGVSELITLVQGCIAHDNVEGNIHDPNTDKTECKSYIEELDELK